MQPNRFYLSAVLNLDETPIPFGYLDGHTYDFCRAKIVADGVQRIRLKLNFHGTDPTGQIYKREGHQYNREVTVAYNETAYKNEELFDEWITKELCPLLNSLDNLVINVVLFHRTQVILQKLRDSNVTTALIPSGCTSLLQPLDTAVNKSFKDWLREATEEYLDGLSKEDITKWTVSDQRVMTTYVVAAAAKKLTQKADLDHLIRIKDISSSDINLIEWEAQEDL
ncbi:hypothetical protein K469DRAFT_783135 [Zopfia rhizophila CBS 207.26]|uniref:DDE-1 domain-containing protein n=1 Tax=Zopfia rhizophila CBS 207.26 TaxID=1314779 RepID=A0A6A6ERR3_9PEZI|nr:hypothetical protein K469DRAFT_783135 [Zopfia rhizophila CBS 207.26]